MANIVSLTVENFRSYKNKTVFTLEAVDAAQMSGNYHVEYPDDTTPIRILNTAVIYGANAAGKSNVIIALWALYSFVKYSRMSDPSDTIRYEPYMLSEEKRNAPIYFSIRFIAEGVMYDYEYSYNKFAFLSECLKEVVSGRVIFERGENGVAQFNPELPSELERTYLRNHLILSELSLKAIPVIQSVYGIISSMRIVPITDEYYPPSDITNDAAAMVLDEKPESYFSKMLRDLIISSDTGIVGVSVGKIDADQFAFPESVSAAERQRIISEHKYRISMVHPTEEGENIMFPLNVESVGTQTLFKAGALVIKTLEEGGFLAYDEMNIALHPRLFCRLVELFNNEKTNPNHAQLLVTTHDTTLIDENILRADQIWFAEKKNGVSDLYSAIDFDEVRIDQPFESWYRAGRLGAIPFLQPYNIDVKPSSEEE